MNPIAVGRQFDRLAKRRDQLRVTLRHLSKERKAVEHNTDWLDQAAYKNRLQLLERLNGWYVTEMNAIEDALARIEQQRYGYCAACGRAIDAHRLELAPETEFCAGCQRNREQTSSC